MFVIRFCYFLKTFLEAPFQPFVQESETTILTKFCLKFNFSFGLKAQECLETCVNYILKVQPFFLNLASRVLPDTIIECNRTM